jgi:hypothetical protein
MPAAAGFPSWDRQRIFWRFLDIGADPMMVIPTN